ncbi:retropepsin-like aspartic protease [Pedobacter sp. UC225_65]|uniref:retropepsin-like aspartic protease n=1 Tax=Pedobacter sp. UC225_65 TaxID=3350173 RepID=UPI00366DCD81
MKYRINQIKPPFIIFIVTLIGLQLCFSGQSYGQKFTFGNGLKKDVLTFNKVKNLIIIPLFINGKGPFNFLLDTGVDPLIITDVALVDSLNIKEIRPIKINGVGPGNEINAFFSKEPSVRVGEASMANMPTVILKEDVFNLSGYLGVKIYGLIGYYFFNSFIVKINYYTNRINFRLPETRKRMRDQNLILSF